jgi:hypothetical protein
MVKTGQCLRRPARVFEREQAPERLMRKVVCLEEIVESAHSGHDGWDLCATARVAYDTSGAMLVIDLDALVRPHSAPPGCDGFHEPWLPAPRVVRRRVRKPEARVVAKKVFARWVESVRRAIPSAPHLAGDGGRVGAVKSPGRRRRHETAFGVAGPARLRQADHG